MSTIAKTNRYKELNYRHRKLIQLYAVVSELRLHTNRAVDVNIANYYRDKLYAWDDYAPFLAASMESMMQVFYIELDGFVGSFWDPTHRRVQQRDNDRGSLAAYLYDGTRITRKKSAKKAFESLLEHKASDLEMIHKIRHKLAHFEKLDERSNALVPGGTETREILNKLAEILYLLGFQRWNKPHYIKQDNNSSESTQKVVDRLVPDNEEAQNMRKDYIDARDRWFSK
jgi:hypothetical protein